MNTAYEIIIGWLLLQLASILLFLAFVQIVKAKSNVKRSVNALAIAATFIPLLGAAGFGYAGVYTVAKCVNTNFSCRTQKIATIDGNPIKFTTPKDVPTEPAEGDKDSISKDEEAPIPDETPAVPSAEQPNPLKPSPVSVETVDYGYYQQAYDWARSKGNCKGDQCLRVVQWRWPNWSVETFYDYPPIVGAGLIAGHDNMTVLHLGNVMSPYPRTPECQQKKAGYILRLTGDESVDILNDGTPNKVSEQLNDKTPAHIAWKKVEGFYYVYAYPPQGLCSAEYAEQQAALTKVVQTMIRNLAPLPDGKNTCSCSKYSEVVTYIESK